MKLHPRLSRTGLELVKRFEGLRRKAARLPGGGWTIGYGHTASAREGAEVTPADAEALLLYDLNKVAVAVDEAVFTPLNQNQFDALTAFAFNIGLDNFRRSAVLKRLNEGAYLQAAAALELWRKAEFEGERIVVDALVRRRAAEKALFLTPVEGFRPVPTPVVTTELDAAAPELAPSAGLATAADLRVSMDGETATARLHEAPPVEPKQDDESAPAIAARNVADRLNRLLEPDEPPPFPEPQPEAEPPELEPAPVAAFPEEPPPPPPPTYIAPPPLVHQRPAVAFPPLEEEPPPAATRGDRLVEPYPEDLEPVASVPAGSIDPPEPPHQLAVMATGVFGAALFFGALATILFGRATLVNLALGLLGIVCMTPAGVRLLTHLMRDRPRRRDRD